jgi:chorismate-pyruvate lyase
MKPKAARPIQSLQWIPAERLGQFRVDARLRAWLIAKGVLSIRLREMCGVGFSFRLLDQWSGILTASQRLGLKSEDQAGLYREVALADSRGTHVFAQTVMPDSTLCLHPWLADLGETPLDEVLHGLSGVERGAYEYAWLEAEPTTPGPANTVPASPGRTRGIEPLAERALRDADIKPGGLWARRMRIALRGAPLLIQEVFLPGIGRDSRPGRELCPAPR